MVYKCKMCGGDIAFKPGASYGRCEYCDSVCTLPKTGDETRLNRYNRADHLRRTSEFDKAIAAYEKIIEDNGSDAEAHWGLVLSKFGIEYVPDPVSGRRVPTCHRASIESILADEDYLAALDNAPDEHSRALYEAQANEIAAIQKRILTISQNEKPYDVFICYKEADENGRRTVDSTLAQEIYYTLVNEGCKVFFSRISLEDKLGQEYEPYIFSALNSARVMLVVGTKPEYFNAVWVKNEWSRYLKLIKAELPAKKRVLIPCYRDMDPYELPDELGNLQSQDMSRIGFTQDIIRGVKKLLAGGGNAASAPKASQTNPLLRRATLFLEDEDWDSADAYAEKVLDLEPENARAYLIKLMAERRVSSEDELGRQSALLADSPNYKKALRFADDALKKRLSDYNKAIENEEARLEQESKRVQMVLDTLGSYNNDNGDVGVLFGKYRLKQSLLGGKDPIEWLVLDVKADKALLLSRYALDCRPFNNRQTDVDWSDCSLRKWLNTDFMNAAFNQHEIEQLTKAPSSKENLGFDALAPEDKVFLLSEAEATKYFLTLSARSCSPIPSLKHAAKTEKGACWWWLRSPGGAAGSAEGITPDGETGSFYVNSNGICVRPAIWVKPI